MAVPSLHVLSRRVLSALEHCRIVAGIGVGYNTTDLDAADELGIAITNTPDYCIDEVSSHAIALMLAMGRRLFHTDRAIRRKPVSFNRTKRA